MVYVVSHLIEIDSDKNQEQPHVSSITVSRRKATLDTDLSWEKCIQRTTMDCVTCSPHVLPENTAHTYWRKDNHQEKMITTSPLNAYNIFVILSLEV
jgi:hypothetical protein